MVNQAVPVRIAHRLSAAAMDIWPVELSRLAFLMCMFQPVAPVRPTASIARLPIRGTSTDQRHGIPAWLLPNDQLPAHRPGISLSDTCRPHLRHCHLLGGKRQVLTSGVCRHIFLVRLSTSIYHGSSCAHTPTKELDFIPKTFTCFFRACSQNRSCQRSVARKLIIALRTATCSSRTAP
jgi:hypothetical protein